MNQTMGHSIGCHCKLCGINEVCNCVVSSRREDESQREWFKRWMCMFHWMQTDYYRAKLEKTDGI